MANPGALNSKKLHGALMEYREFCEGLCADLDIPCRTKDFAVLAFPDRKDTGGALAQHSRIFKKLKDGKDITSETATALLSAYRQRYRELLQQKVEQYGESKGFDLDEEVLECEAKIRRSIGLPAWKPEPGMPVTVGFLNAGHFVVRSGLPDLKTPAIERHDRARFRSFAADLKFEAPAQNAYLSLAKNDLVGAEFVEKRPAAADLSNFKVTADSSLFDNIDWEPVTDPKDILERPIQMSYYTRVVELEIPDDPPESIGFEFNTGGFGVFPVPDHDLHEDQRPRVLMQRNMRMAEMPESTEGRATYQIYPIPDELAGQRHTFVLRTLYVNGLQDQFSKVDEDSEDGDYVDTDWYAKRVTPIRTNRTSR